MPGETVRSKPRSAAVRVAVVLAYLAVLALLALSGWEGVSSRDSSVAHAGVLVVVAIALVAMVVAAVVRHRLAAAEPVPDAAGQAPARVRRRTMVAGSVVWVLLFAEAVGWDVFSFSQQSANDPTLSSLIGHLTQFDAGRAALFALWVAAGWLLATATPTS